MDIKTTLKSLMMLGIIAALFGGATYAVFSDTEENTGTMVVGTIDMAVDGQNPWVETGLSEFLTDMKPDAVHYGDIVVENVGLNPMMVYKKLDNYVVGGGIMTEPECDEAGGTYDNEAASCTVTSEDNIAPYVLYDMSVGVYTSESAIPDEADEALNDGTVIIDENDNIYLGGPADVRARDKYFKLGLLAPGEYMLIRQSYRLDRDVTNWAQGDTLTFDVELYGAQVDAAGVPLVPPTPEYTEPN